MAGTPITGTTKAGVTITQQIPVILGGVTSAGVVKPLLVSSAGVPAGA